MMALGELDGTQVTVFSAAHPSSSRKRPYIERALQVLTHSPSMLVYVCMCVYIEAQSTGTAAVPVSARL